MDLMTPPGVHLVMGPPSSGKSRYVREAHEELTHWDPALGMGPFLRDYQPTLWTTSWQVHCDLLGALLCLNDPSWVPNWFGRGVLDDAIHQFTKASAWAVKFPPNTPSATKMRIIKSRIMDAIAHQEASLYELTHSSLKVIRREDLEEEQKATIHAIQSMSATMDTLDMAGRFDDAAVIFSQRSKSQAKLRMLTGAIEQQKNVPGRSDRKLLIETSIAEGMAAIGEAENLVAKLSARQVAFQSDATNYGREITGLETKITPNGVIEIDSPRPSSTEKRGLQVAVALALRNATGFPFVLVEDGHFPEAARKYLTTEIEVGK